MKPQKPAAKTVKNKSKPADTQTVSPVGFSLEPVYTALRKRYPSAGQAEAVAFAADFYKRMEADEFPHHSAEEWAALAADTLEFARVRKPGKANVRVFNPTLKSNGWESPHTVLQIVNDDMPFLVDTVTMSLAEHGVGVHVLGHPVIRFARDKAGKLTTVSDGTAESVMLLEIDRQPAEAMADVEKAIIKALDEVRAIVRDWDAMRAKAQSLADDLGS
ncbi:MAG: NAD-glutamate dehydrogenase, partial [Stenotrophomonas bentonitica]